MKRIWLSPPHMSGAERKYVDEAFETNWIAPLGPNVNAFEDSLFDYTGRFALAVNSGTAALHLALCLLEIKKDDIVFCQSLTFAGSAFPIQYMGAVPVFIDSEPDSWNIDPDLLNEALEQYAAKGKLPKAIIITHIYGMPADMKRITAIAEKYHVPVIEDAAEAVGSFYDNKPCGALADFSIYSFNGNKIITTSGGGALLSTDKRAIDKARKLSMQAKENFLHYEHCETGFNYRLSNICAGIGRGQLEVLHERVEKRRQIFQNYQSQLGYSEGITYQNEQQLSYANRWLTVAMLDDEHVRQSFLPKIIEQLTEANIECRPVWKPMHRQPVFNHAPAFINGVSDKLFESCVCLPSGSELTSADLQLITSLIRKVILLEKTIA